MIIVKDGTYRKLVIKNCKEEDAGKYRYEADGRKTEADLKVEGRFILFTVYTHKYSYHLIISDGRWNLQNTSLSNQLGTCYRAKLCMKK